MIPEPKNDNTLLMIAGLLVIAIIVVALMIYLPPAEEEAKETDGWINEGGMVLSPNATATLILSEVCTDCISARLLLESLQNSGDSLGISITDVETVYDSSQEGRNLIIKYKIEKLPSLVLQKEGSWDNRLLSMWFSGVGSVEDDGTLIYREPAPPYFDTKTDSTRGKLRFIYLVDGGCTECYNVSAFANDLVVVFGMYVEDITEYDISSVEGNAIASQYGITKVPTFLVSGDASVYSGFEDFWFRYTSTKEDDGWYVFRDHEQIDAEYRELNATETG